MTHSILYYPKFEPEQKWLRSTLLFFDEIQRIVPAEAKHVDSEPTQRLLELMPDAIKTVAPTEPDKNFDELNFDRLKKAFALIRDRAGGTPFKSFRFRLHPGGQISGMQGDVWLSNAKLEQRVRELLFEYNLASDFTNPYTGRGPFGDTFPANEEASNLIISYVADRIATRTGFNTITDVEIPYTVQSLDALSASTASLHREGEGLLAAAVANLEVPDAVERLNPHDYQELHQSFQAIREPFHSLIDALSRRFKLDRQQSGTALESRVQQALADYQKQMGDYKKYASTRTMNKWTPIYFQGLLSLLIPFSPPEAQFIEAGGIFSVEVMKNVFAGQEAKIENEEAFRMLCQLRRSIDQKSAVSELV